MYSQKFFYDLLRKEMQWFEHYLANMANVFKIKSKTKMLG